MSRLRPRSQVVVGCRAGFRLSGRATVAGGLSEKRAYVRGLDVHAWSVTGQALDGDTGEVWQRKLTPDPAEVLAWVSTLPGPVKVGYKAGPTGYGLYRFLNDHGVACVVGAPSKMHRPHGDRVKTDLLTELSAEFFGWCVRWLIGLSRFAGCDQRRGHAAGVVRAGG